MSQERTVSGFTVSDGVLLFCFVAFATSGLQKFYLPDDFAECQRPIHMYLLTSYVALLGLRIPHYLRKFNIGGGEQGEAWKRCPREILKCAWYALLVGFTLWTITGSVWLAEVLDKTPSCLPMSVDQYIIIFWQVVCYLWIVIYSVCVALAFSLKHRQEEAEGNLRQVESADTRERWGSITAEFGLGPNTGLKAKEISSLPSCHFADGYVCTDQDCSICLVDFETGDALRRLPNCGHHFHKACIDLWLLRQNKCPLCKTDVLRCEPCEGTDTAQRLV